MSTNKFDQNTLVGIGDVYDQPILVAADVKHDTVVSNKVHRVSKLSLYVGW